MTAAQVRALLTAHEAARERVADEHMFTVAVRGRWRTTFRLQLFTAPGKRGVAVATQIIGESASLHNFAEACAADVWRRYLPGTADPPIWIERLLSPISRASRNVSG